MPIYFLVCELLGSQKVVNFVQGFMFRVRSLVDNLGWSFQIFV